MSDAICPHGNQSRACVHCLAALEPFNAGMYRLTPNPRTIWEPIWSKAPEHAAIGIWGIDAPGDHPNWSQYMALLVHLRPMPTLDALHQTVKYIPNATHEFQLYAIHPDHRFTEAHVMGQDSVHTLQPLNYGYQFEAESDDAAHARALECLRKAPTLDTDMRRYWDRELWPNAYPLVRSGFRRDRKPPPKGGH